MAPDIEAANILYRAILYFAGGESGGIVVGAKVPLICFRERRHRIEDPVDRDRGDGGGEGGGRREVSVAQAIGLRHLLWRAGASHGSYCL